ncbi:MAG: MoxR family ATPase [Acidobacteriota bacterium]|nr:MoxR family ATPase [Acidobacteriota bacterium]
MDSRQAILSMQEAMARAVIGQDQVVERIVICILCNGNLLLEGLPGTAKTRSIKTLAGVLAADLGRIQFTPDLLPSDVTGTEVFNAEGGDRQLVFQPGPIFNNLVLADEINRSPAKVQAALLEAMEERQITVAGKTYKLPELFMVLATQNPIEQEGTYPLPEAQMDRFLMKVSVDYPESDAELAVMRLVRGEESGGSEKAVKVDQEHVFTARSAINQLHIAENVERYIVDLVMATRNPDRHGLEQWIEIGASPRATIAMDKCARAHAWLHGKEYVDPDDVRAIVHGVLRHRITLSYEAAAEGKTTDLIIDDMLKAVAVA